ncbi:MAG: hypothetical protein WC029_06900 [Sulfuricella sp.]|jgi:hypothetical protein
MLGNWLKTTTLMAAVVALLDIHPSTKKRGAHLMSMVRGVA